MDDMASVGLQVDSRQVRGASGDLDKFARSGDGASRSATGVTGAIGGMSAKMVVAAAAAAALTAALAAGKLLNNFVDATVQAEAAQAQLGAVIASTGGAAGRSLAQLNEHAAALQKVTNFGDEATNAMQGVLLTFTEIKGDQFDAATVAIQNVATAMNQDLMAAALQVGKALNDPVQGMTALGRSGITFTEAQKDMVKEMVAANDIIGAQTLILAELEKQFGGSAEAARDTLGGALDSLRNAWGDLFEMAGPASENLRASTERLTAAVANPAFFAAVQSIGTALFAAAEMGVNALAALLPVVTAVVENIDVIAYSAGIAATVFAGPYVVAMGAAAIASFSLTGALAILKKALISTGIGALIVGAGYLVAMFMRLVGAAGGFGNALDLLKDVAVEVWDRVSLSADAAWVRVEAGWATAQAGIYDGLQDATAAVVGWANSTVNTFEGTFLAVQTIWGALPDVFERVGALAINGLVEVMETGIAGITKAVNAVLTLGGRRPEWAIAAPDLSEWKSAVPEAVNLGAQAREAYDSAFSDNPFQVPDLFGGMVDDARGRASGYSEAAGMLSDAAARPMTAWQALRTVIDESAAATEGAAAAATTMNKTLEDIGGDGTTGAGGGSAGNAANAIEGATTFAGGFADAMVAGAKSAAEMGSELGGSLLRGIGSVSDAFGDFVMSGLKDFKGFVSSILSSFKSMLAQMISMAVRNRIMSGLGFSGGGAGPAAAGGAPGGPGGMGGGGGLLGRAGSMLGGLGSAAVGGFMKAGGALLGAGGGIGSMFTSIGGQIGAAMTGSLTAIAGAIGAVALPVMAVAAVFSFFKKKTKELDAGLKVTVDGLDTLVQTFRTIETKRFWGLSKKVRTSFQNASDEIANPLIKAIGEMQGGIVNSAEALGISAAVFDGFAHTLQVSTKGLSDEAAQEAVMEAFERMGDAFAGMIPGLQALQKDGEGAMDAISRLAQSLAAVNGWMGNFRMNLYNVSLAGAGAASAFVDLFGSLENFNAVSQSYYANFFTDAERIARATELLSIEMLALGVGTLPATRAAFRALVDEADALGDSELVASLMQLSPAFAEISAGADALGDSLRALVNEDLFATGQDYVRGLSRASNSQTFTPQQSDAELRAELRALNVSMERLLSTSEITAGNTGRGADAADDTLAFTLEQTL